MTTPRTRGRSQPADSQKRCVQCGRDMPSFTPEHVSARLRKLLAEVGKPRPINPAELEPQRHFGDHGSASGGRECAARPQGQTAGKARGSWAILGALVFR